MTVHLISVGRSLLDSFENPRAKLRESALRDAMLREKPQDVLNAALVQSADRDPRTVAATWLAGALAPAGEPGHDPQSASVLASMATAIQPGLWPPALSAELDTFDQARAGRPVRQADIAVLICSDTVAGLVAGLWNAVALTGDPARVRFLRSPDLPPPVLRGGAILVRVPGMDAANEEGFRDAMRGLGTLGRHLLDGGLDESEPFRFYLSGGFKAAIPYLVGLAEGLRSVDPGRPVEALVAHETAGDGSKPIRLPLRTLIRSQVKRELQGFNGDGEQEEVPSPSLLEGYAYEMRGTKCVLTPFGEGLRALFGFRPERPGG